MSKTIEVYLWLNEPDGYVIDMVVDGETVHSKNYFYEIKASADLEQLVSSLGLNEVESRSSHIKYSNQ